MTTDLLKFFISILGLIAVIAFLLAMLVTPTPTPTVITVTGMITVPVGMTPTGATVQLFNENNTLVGQTTVGESGAFHFDSASSIIGTYTIIATKGYATGKLQVGLGYGDNNAGVITLERGLH
jgi:xanthosine utilization system XapX-like protein